MSCQTWSDKLRNGQGHVVLLVSQSRAFRILFSTFPHFTDTPARWLVDVRRIWSICTFGQMCCAIGQFDQMRRIWSNAQRLTKCTAHLTKAKQRCVMGIGMCHCASMPSLCKRKKAVQKCTGTYITMLSSVFIWLLFPTPVNSTLESYNTSWSCQNLSSLLLKVSVVSADITISGNLFHIFTILGAKENFLKS